MKKSFGFIEIFSRAAQRNGEAGLLNLRCGLSTKSPSVPQHTQAITVSQPNAVPSDFWKPPGASVWDLGSSDSCIMLRKHSC